MNGFQPIAGRHEQHALVSAKGERGIASSSACAHYASMISGPNRKSQLLEQCARIGFTPPSLSMLDDVSLSFDVLEVSPCLNNLCLKNLPS